FTANLKRQIQGTHHSTSKKHLPRYLEEYDYKYNTRDMSDTERTEAAIANMEGRRVTLYKRAYGTGDALIGHKSSERGEQGTLRGRHSKRQKSMTKRRD
ncbi:MAG: transposase, partial [Polyangia bacterium]